MDVLAQHGLILPLADQDKAGIGHTLVKAGQDIDGKLLVFLKMEPADAGDHIAVRPSQALPDGIPPRQARLDLLHIDGIADDHGRMAQGAFAAPSRIEPAGGIVRTGPEVRRVLPQASPVGLVQEPAQPGVHVLRVVAVDDPPGDPVFFCHFQIIDIGQAVDIDPDGLVLLRMPGKKCLQLLFEAQGILPAGGEMDCAPAHGMDLVFKGHGVIGVAQKIEVEPGEVDPPVIIHQEAFDSAGVFRHAENKNIVHRETQPSPPQGGSSSAGPFVSASYFRGPSANPAVPRSKPFFVDASSLAGIPQVRGAGPFFVSAFSPCGHSAGPWPRKWPRRPRSSPRAA